MLSVVVVAARVYCAVGDLASVQKELETRGYVCSLVQFVHRPLQQYMQDMSSEADVAALTTMLEAFENDPDCQVRHVMTGLSR